MPIYSHQCNECGSEHSVFAKVADRDDVAPDCCGVKTHRVLDAPMVQVPGGLDCRYECPMSGEKVTSMRRRKYLMDKNDVVDSRDLQDSWKKIRQDRAETKAELARLDAQIPDAVKKAAMATAPVLP